MRRAIKMFVLFPVLCGMWTPAKAEAQTCYVRTDSYFEIEGNTDE